MRRLSIAFAFLLVSCGSSRDWDEGPRGARLAAVRSAFQGVVPGARMALSGPFSSLTLDGALSGPYVSDCELFRAIVDVSGALADGTPEVEARLLLDQARLHEAALAAGGLVRIASHGTGIGDFQRSGDHVRPAQDLHRIRVAAGKQPRVGPGLQGASYMLSTNAPRWVTWSAYVAPTAGATAFVRMELDRTERLLLIEISYSDRSVLDRPHPFSRPPWTEAIVGGE